LKCIFPNSIKPSVNKIKYSLTTKNGLEHNNFDVAKLDGNNDVLVIIVGINSSVNGYKDKYFQIAKRANEIYGSTIFIVNNNEHNWYVPKNYFDAIIRYIRENMQNYNKIRIKLFGHSAGATLATYYAWEYPEISDLLLVNPPLFKENLETTVNAMKLFTGNATLVVGKNDPSYKFGELFSLSEYTEIFNNVVLFDKADHNFKGLLKEIIELPFKYLYD